jgi:excisionase family DNA binding protein
MLQIDGDVYLDVREASERLGVKPETLYAYVSRGLIKSYRQGVRRRRLYLAHEIELLLALQPSKSDIAPEPSVAAPATELPEPRQTGTPPRSAAAADGELPTADSWAAER